MPPQVSIGARRARRLSGLRRAACLAAARLRDRPAWKPERHGGQSTSGWSTARGQRRGTGGARQYGGFDRRWRGRKRAPAGAARRPSAGGAGGGSSSGGGGSVGSLRSTGAAGSAAGSGGGAAGRGGAAGATAGRGGSAGTGAAAAEAARAGSGTGGSAHRRHGRRGHVPEGRRHDPQLGAAGSDDQPGEVGLAEGADLAVAAGRARRSTSPPWSTATWSWAATRSSGSTTCRTPRRRNSSPASRRPAAPGRRGREPHRLVRPLRRHASTWSRWAARASTPGTSPAPPRPSTSRRSRFPGTNYGDYTEAVWGVSWQGQYIYVGATNNGIKVVDAANPAAPKIVDRGSHVVSTAASAPARSTRSATSWSS